MVFTFSTLQSSLHLMDPLIFIAVTSLCAFLLSLTFYLNQQNKKRRLPRAGGGLPIIGHLHQFIGKQLLHRKLAAMAEKYGDAFTMKLGSEEYLVVSSLEIARECFTTLDKIFADRPKKTASRILGYDYAFFGFAPYGNYWRHVRKIVTLDLLSRRRLHMMAHVRASELHTSLRELHDLWANKRDSETGFVVDMKQWFGDVALNASVRMVGGKRLSAATKENKLIRDFFYYLGVFVLGDALPSLAWLDFQGHERGMKRVAKGLDDVVGEWLLEHKQRRNEGRGGDENFMDAMLSLMEDADFQEFEADVIIKATCLTIVVGGSETIMVTLTWALSLLLNNPSVLEKAQQEVDAHVSKDRHVNESDIKNFVYLEAVVKETLRLYPPASIIGLHSAIQDCTLSPNYHVPSGIHLLVNIWKIQHDQNIWSEPHEFWPERFLTTHKDIDVRGHNFELLPFGSGRRSCPGTSMALKMVHLTLASLVHCYELSRPSDVEIDMTESPGHTTMKASPLEVCITPRIPREVFGI